MKWIILLVLLGLNSRVGAREWRPTPQFLEAVSLIESSRGRFVYGDNGRSLGAFQLTEAAWLDVNQWRKAKRLKIYSYDRYVFHGYISRVYAADYLAILHRQLSGRLGRAPTHSELYAAYNMGFASFAACQFQLQRVNSVTREKCRQIDLMMARGGS